MSDLMLVKFGVWLKMLLVFPSISQRILVLIADGRIYDFLNLIIYGDKRVMRYPTCSLKIVDGAG